jgi:hypothetical protein
MLSASDESSKIEYLCTLNLVMTIFRITSQDLKYGNKETKRDARRFLKSVWFSELCSNMGLDCNRVRKLIMDNDRIGSRASYE